MFFNAVISHCMYKICLHFLTPLSTDNYAEHFDAYLIASCPSQSDLSTANDQRSPHKSILNKDTDYKTNDIEQNCSQHECINLCVRLLIKEVLLVFSCVFCAINY